jgi:hypothetical protein
MRLTRGEAWWLVRKRVGITQAEMSKAHGISEDLLREWEKDRAPAPGHLDWPDDFPAYLETPISPGEYCAIMRRRAGRSVADESARLGLSRVRYIEAEAGRAPRSAFELACRWRDLPKGARPRPRAAAPVLVPGPALAKANAPA